MDTAQTRQVLAELLDANTRFSLSAKGTTNHCPMALAALAGMGAGPERLRAFFGRWEHEYALPAPPLGPAAARADWRSFAAGGSGREDDFEALHACFRDWMAEDGVDAVLRQVLGQVPFSPAIGAFHALIRLGHGLEAGHDGEAAAGLAYLVVGKMEIPAPPHGRAPAATAAEGLARLSSAMAGCQYGGESITGKLRAAAADPRFIDAQPPAPPTDALLDELADIAIAAYWQTKNFTVLHLVTGVRAARLLFERLPPSLAQSLLPPLWLAVCAAYATVGAPALESRSKLEAGWAGSAPTPQGWAELLAAAVEADNEHVIKLCHACHQESLRDPSPLYYAAVSRALGRMA